MISGGYGDNDEFFEEKIRERERLIKLQAAERSSNPSMWDDLLQEGAITVWQVVTKRPDAPGSYINKSVGYRLTALASESTTWTGQPTRQGLERDPLRRKDRDSFDDPDWQIYLEAADVLETVLARYHQGDIVKALSELPERDRAYAVLRFWGGYTNREIAAQLNISAATLEEVWRKRTRPQLVDRLAHLRRT